MDYLEVLEARHRAMVEKDAQAKAKGTMVGRFIREPCADSYAFYEIVKVNKKTVVIQHLDVYDGWTIPYWGKRATIDIRFAQENLAYRDNLERLLAERRH